MVYFSGQIKLNQFKSHESFSHPPPPPPSHTASQFPVPTSQLHDFFLDHKKTASSTRQWRFIKPKVHSIWQVGMKILKLGDRNFSSPPPPPLAVRFLGAPPPPPIFSEPLFGCLKIFGTPPHYVHPHPLVIFNELSLITLSFRLLATGAWLEKKKMLALVVPFSYNNLIK